MRRASRWLSEFVDGTHAAVRVPSSCRGDMLEELKYLTQQVTSKSSKPNPIYCFMELPPQKHMWAKLEYNSDVIV